MNRKIEVDADALERLNQARRDDESYSAVIRRCVPQRRSLEAILEALRKGPSVATLEAADESLTLRRRCHLKEP